MPSNTTRPGERAGPAGLFLARDGRPGVSAGSGGGGWFFRVSMSSSVCGRAEMQGQLSGLAGSGRRNIGAGAIRTAGSRLWFAPLVRIAYSQGGETENHDAPRR